MLIGNYLVKEEIDELIGSFKEKEKFNNLIKEMQYKSEFSVNLKDAKVINAIKFDAMHEEDVISAKVLYLELSDNVKIRYTIRHRNGDKSTQNDFFVGELTQEDDESVKVLNYRARDEHYISMFESEFTQEAVALAEDVDHKTREAFPVDENYYAGMLLDQDIETAGFLDGCLPGGYIWCGQKCGGSAACTSTKNGINGLDNCCKIHDCCYTRLGVKHPHCFCDQSLCDCSQNKPIVFSTPVVQAIFCFVC